MRTGCAIRSGSPKPPSISADVPCCKANQRGDGAFTLKFADIAQRHRVLFGEDPFAGGDHAARCVDPALKQVLLNMQIRARGTLHDAVTARAVDPPLAGQRRADARRRLRSHNWRANRPPTRRPALEQLVALNSATLNSPQY